MEKAKRISRGSVCPLILFHQQLHKLCSSSDHLSSLAETQSSSSSFSTPLSVIHDKIDHFGLDEIKKRLIEYLAAVRLKELNADREAAATTVAREETAQQAETTALSMEINPQAPLPVMFPSL